MKNKEVDQNRRRGKPAATKMGPVAKKMGAAGKLDAGFLWKQVEDVAVPGLRLSVIDHVVYTHLLRHSRLEGKRRLKFSILWLARNIHLSTCPTREAVRRLARQGALRLIERSKAGHVVEVRLPEEIRGVRAKSARAARDAARLNGDADIEDADFLKTLELRRAVGVPRPCCAARPSGVQFVPQPGVELYGMQLAKRGATSGGVFTVVVSAAPVERGGTGGAVSGAGIAGCGETASGGCERS